jgi:hypothetical protein
MRITFQHGLFHADGCESQINVGHDRREYTLKSGMRTISISLSPSPAWKIVNIDGAHYAKPMQNDTHLVLQVRDVDEVPQSIYSYFACVSQNVDMASFLSEMLTARGIELPKDDEPSHAVR